MLLEPQTTPQVYSLLEQEQQRLLPHLPTPPLHLSQELLEVDLTLHNPLLSILGQPNPSQPLLLDSQRLLGARSRQQCGVESRALWTRLLSGPDFDLTVSPLNKVLEGLNWTNTEITSHVRMTEAWGHSMLGLDGWE